LGQFEAAERRNKAEEELLRCDERRIRDIEKEANARRAKAGHLEVETEEKIKLLHFSAAEKTLDDLRQKTLDAALENSRMRLERLEAEASKAWTSVDQAVERRARDQQALLASMSPASAADSWRNRWQAKVQAEREAKKAVVEITARTEETNELWRKVKEQKKTLDEAKTVNASLNAEFKEAADKLSAAEIHEALAKQEKDAVNRDNKAREILELNKRVHLLQELLRQKEERHRRQSSHVRKVASPSPVTSFAPAGAPLLPETQEDEQPPTAEEPVFVFQKAPKRPLHKFKFKKSS